MDHQEVLLTNVGDLLRPEVPPPHPKTVLLPARIEAHNFPLAQVIARVRPPEVIARVRPPEDTHRA